MEDHSKLGLLYDAPYQIKINLRYWASKIPHGIRHTLLRPAFWIGMTLGFPVEHLLWERVWPFSWITKNLLGL